MPMAAGTLEVFAKYNRIDELDASLLNLRQARWKSEKMSLPQLVTTLITGR